MGTRGDSAYDMAILPMPMSMVDGGAGQGPRQDAHFGWAAYGTLAGIAGVDV